MQNLVLVFKFFEHSAFYLLLFVKNGHLAQINGDSFFNREISNGLNRRLKLKQFFGLKLLD